jgi:flagella basal body P-ring formation protein FlgA
MKFTIFTTQSAPLRSFLREFALGLIILFALVALNALAMPPTSPGKLGVFERFENALVSNLVDQLAARMQSEPNLFKVSIENLKVKPALPQFENSRVQVLGLGALANRRLDGLTGFNVSIESLDPGSKPVDVYVSGVVKITGPVIVSNRNFIRGDLITENDISFRILPWNTLPTSAMGVPLTEHIGKTARTQILAGALVFSDLVEESAFVKNGDSIELTVLSGPGVIIRSHGIARQSGRVGDSVRVEYLDTKKSLVGMVTGKKAVEVRL